MTIKLRQQICKAGTTKLETRVGSRLLPLLSEQATCLSCASAPALCAGRTVAVKQLSMASLSGVGDREFLLEVALLSRLHHCHLVQLVGYCGDAQERLLVYEYMPAGTLREHLNGQAWEFVCSVASAKQTRLEN